MLGHYDSTDLSSRFFAAAQQKFATWEALIDFRKLDIGSGPAERGFTFSSCDHVVAEVFHITPDLTKTMTHV